VGRNGKYNARRSLVDGILFDSGREAKRYQELRLLEAGGKIRDLELQPVYQLLDGFVHRGERIRGITYRADFRYFDIEKECEVVEDVKGHKTEVYKLKRKMLLSRYPDIDFREI